MSECIYVCMFRSPKSMNMNLTPSGGGGGAQGPDRGSISSEMGMASSTEMKEPWPLDEIDSALDKLLKEDKFLTEAEVTNAIDKVSYTHTCEIHVLNSHDSH